MITRFAPSPTGYLHLGHALAAATAFDFASRHDGPCLLRIEDIDHTRCRVDFTKAIYEDLAWLGYDWPQPVRVQSAHMSDYQGALSTLKDKALIYPCFKTRREIAAHCDEGGVYRGQAKLEGRGDIQARIEKGEPCAWRLSMSAARDYLGEGFEQLAYEDTGSVNSGVHTVRAWGYGDEIIARKDIGVSYYLACTHDDAVQSVTHIVRGADFIALTGFQVLLQALMGWSRPIYHHHDLLMAGDGKKLSKRDGAASIRSLREKGFHPKQVLDMAMARNRV